MNSNIQYGFSQFSCIVYYHEWYQYTAAFVLTHDSKIEGVTSKYIGVSWRKDINKWVVNCKLNKTSRQIGTFSQDKEEEAGKLYDTCVLIHSDNPGNCAGKESPVTPSCGVYKK